MHVYSGESSSYTLRRAFHDVGGDRRLLHELDLLLKPETDMSPSGKAYPLLLRMALNGMAQSLGRRTTLQNQISFEAFCRHAETFASLAWTRTWLTRPQSLGS